MIEVKQHVGKTRSGKTVGHPFDQVTWTDGDRKRMVAIVGHHPDAPIVWHDNQVPEATQSKIVEAVRKRKIERAKADKAAAK